MTENRSEPLIRDIAAVDDDDAPEVTELESLCMQCHENGTTKLLLTRIPFFKEIIIMSFSCPYCHFKENEIKSASEIQPKGIRYTLKVNSSKMMSRQIVKQPSAMFQIPELGFEAPEFTSKGAFTTIEGLFVTAIAGLEQQQPVRKIMDPDLAEKIDDCIRKLDKHKSGEIPFTLIVEDISGNSFIENPFAPKADSAMTVEHFERTELQNSKLGISSTSASSAVNEEKSEEGEVPEEDAAEDDLKQEVLEFAGNCPSCQSPAVTKMKILDIPHFKEIVVMAIACDACGYKSNDVKAGGAIESRGKKITFKMTDPTDLTRDVLTSDTCTVEIPELELELCHMSESGKFTTLEGLLINMQEKLGQINPFAFGDSADEREVNRMKKLKEDLQKVINCELLVSINLDDPVGNSYLQNLYAPDQDPHMSIELYERTPEQDEILGIADMKLTDY